MRIYFDRFMLLKIVLNYKDFFTNVTFIFIQGFIGSGELKVSLEKYFNEYLERFSRELRTLAKKYKVNLYL